MTLIERLEAAEKGGTGLDAEIHGITLPDEFFAPLDRPFQRYTTSLDAALALAERVLPGWHVARIGEARESDDRGAYVGGWEVRLHCTVPGMLTNLAFGEAPTPALALCIAILKAKEAEK